MPEAGTSSACPLASAGPEGGVIGDLCDGTSSEPLLAEPRLRERLLLPASKGVALPSVFNSLNTPVEQRCSRGPYSPEKRV